MPFTFSHPAIILPLLKTRKRFFSASGLVAGSIAPDFEAFIKLKSIKLYSHSWIGIINYDLPLAFVLIIIFQTIIREPLFNNLPLAIQNRFCFIKKVSFKGLFITQFWVLLISILTGITSHLLLDGITHLNIMNIKDNTLYVSSNRESLILFLQILFSVAGLIYMAIEIYKLPAQKTYLKKSNSKWLYWTAIALLTLVIAHFSIETSFVKIEDYFFFSFSIYISSFLKAIIIVSLSYKIWYGIKKINALRMRRSIFN